MSVWFMTQACDQEGFVSESNMREMMIKPVTSCLAAPMYIDEINDHKESRSQPDGGEDND
jgi:hypothetical protein